MRRSIRHVGVAVAASAALGTLGISGLATAAAATAARQSAPSAAAARALAASGARLWVRRSDSTAGDDAHLAVGPAGHRVYVTGASYGAGSDSDYSTTAYSAATGTRLWAAHYDGPGNGDDSANSVAVSPGGGRVYVTGASPGTTTGADYATVAYSAATGARLWVARYDAGVNAVAVAVSPDGGTVYVTGTSVFGDTGPCTGLAYGTVAYNAATGAQLWAACWADGDEAAALAVSPDGARVYVTGDASCGDQCQNYGTVAFDAATGARLWARQYGGGGVDAAAAVAVSPDGKKVYVTGSSPGPGINAEEDYATIAYNAVSGARLWARRYDAPAHSGDNAVAVVVSPAGTVLVTGDSRGSTSHYDYATIAYKATGARLWVRRYNGPRNGFDFASAVAVPGNGKVYVTGSSWAGPAPHGGDDFATVAYNILTGARAWVRRYNGPASGADNATAVAARGGRVFITGISSPATDSQNFVYATIAYRG
jgi:outer membrane protein assembly factor BamB